MPTSRTKAKPNANAQPTGATGAFSLALSAQSQELSTDHKRFKTLLTKIKNARSRLQDWDQQLPVFAKGHQERAKPVQLRTQQSHRERVFELGVLYDRHALSDANQRTLSELICEMAADILDNEPNDRPETADGPTSHAALKALYNRFAETDFDADEREDVDEMRGFMETMGGLNLGEEPITSMDELMQRAHEAMLRKGPPEGDHQPGADPFDELFGNPFGDAASGAGPFGFGPRRRTKSASAKASAAQQRAAEDAKKVSQTVREVYRKLAAALHPDRTAPGASAAEQSERTALMAQANAAYEKSDLLALLNLQLQIEQVDAAHVAQVTAGQVKHFNSVLAEQLRELQAEIQAREGALCASYGVTLRRSIAPEKLGELLDDLVLHLDDEELRLRQLRRHLQGPVANLKRWLKEERRLRKDDGFDAELDMLF